MSPTDSERLATLEADMRNVCEKVDDLNSKMDKFIASADAKYVSTSRFWPVEKAVYGLMGAVLLSVLYLILASVGIHV